MKNYLSASIFSFCLFTVAFSQSQWQKLNGPYGTSVSEMINHNGTVFITTNDGQTTGDIFSTGNNGINWTNITGTLTTQYTRNFASIGANLYLAQDTSVFMSSNNGSTWTDISGNLPIYDPVSRIAAHNNILFTVAYDGSGYEELYYTTNNGVSWTTTGFIQGLNSSFNDFYSDGNNFWAATGEGIYLSTDDGLTWTNKSTNIPFSAFVQSIVAHGDTLYCGTSNGVYNSVDGANLWNLAIGGITQQTFGNCFVISGNTVYMGTTDFGVYSTALGNGNWTSVGTLPNYTYVKSMAINGNELLIGAMSGFYSYTLPGGSWTLHVDGILQATIRAVYAQGNMILAADANSRGIQISSDGGATWQPTSIGTGKYIFGIKKFGSTYFAFSSLSGLYTSPDGTNWTFMPISNVGTNCMVSSGNNLLLGSTNGIYVSSDNGITWQLTGIGLPANPNVYDIAVNGIDVFVTIGNNKIYVSHDGGNSFSEGNQGLTFNSYCTHVAVVDDYVVAFTHQGIYRSNDDGANFSLAGFSNYVSPYNTYTSGKNLFVASYDGVWVTDDIAKTWHTWNDGFSINMGGVYSIAADGQILYGGTATSAVWKRNFLPQLTTSNVSGAPFCAGNSITVNFNTTATFNPGNKFYVQLSDSSGHFANPVILDSLMATSPAPITTNIPLNSAEGVYRIRVVATDPYVVLQDNGFDFTINEIPSIYLQPANQHTCDGFNTGFFVGANGTNISYQWQVNTGGSVYNNLSNNATYAGVNNDLLLISNASGSMNAYKYRCIISGTCAPQDTSNFGVLNVSTPAPSISLQPADVTVCDLSAASFTVNATGPSLTYQWQCDNGSGFFTDVNNFAPYSGVTTNTLSISSAAALMDGFRYRCKLSDCFDSNDALLTVNGTPVSPNISIIQTVCNGGTAIIGVSVPGAGIGYQWQEDAGSGFVNVINGGNYTGANSEVLSVANLTPAMNGYQYQCIITGLCTPFTSTSNPVQISINTTTATILQQPLNATSCVNSNSSFYVSATITGFLFYNWEMNDGTGWITVPDLPPFSGVDQDTLKIDSINFAMNNYQFRCLVSGCTYSNAATLTVHQLPLVTVNQFPALFCYDDPGVLLSGGLPSGGIYYGSGISGGNFYPAMSGVGTFPLTYFYTDGFGCSSSASQNLVVDFCIGASANENSNHQIDLMIYPNPATENYFQISYLLPQNKKSVLYIYDVTGKVVFENELPANSHKQRFNIPQIANGVYNCVLNSGNYRVSKKLVVIHN